MELRKPITMRRSIRQRFEAHKFPVKSVMPLRDNEYRVVLKYLPCDTKTARWRVGTFGLDCREAYDDGKYAFLIVSPKTYGETE